jgi:acetyl-CoA decarbonylase/synthase complex subunit gamma
MLPWLPFRAFSLKGASLGLASAIGLFFLWHTSALESLSLGLASISVASFTAMNFTGSSTFTSLSGVKKEMQWSIPFQIAFAALGLIMYLVTKIFY